MESVGTISLGPLTAPLTVGADGRVGIPAEMRRAMRCDASGTATAQGVEVMR